MVPSVTGRPVPSKRLKGFRIRWHSSVVPELVAGNIYRKPQSSGLKLITTVSHRCSQAAPFQVYITRTSSSSPSKKDHRKALQVYDPNVCHAEEQDSVRSTKSGTLLGAPGLLGHCALVSNTVPTNRGGRTLVRLSHALRVKGL